ncbi:PAS domain-containing protein [Aestuariispira insulae]|uniref:PAS domain-containing protein n=1 Tax=Aestuariispira insulae TaxID=1461337 RepID=A0A3D9H8K2_9PROT|nr:PAS domain-containing protein [Aestuariispira insulae]RED45822.1 PAS domain-containing protein [Aestuariispira insulae]
MTMAAECLQAARKLDILHEDNRLFMEKWFALRGRRIMPDKSAFRPEEVPKLLSNLILHELEAPDRIRIRLVGTRLVEKYGGDVTGRNYLEFVAPDRQEKASEALWLMGHHPVGMRVILLQKQSSGRTIYSEAMGFPFEDKISGHRMLLFHSNLIDSVKIHELIDDQLLKFNVARRDFIDIGNGIPDFSD